ncbi:MAG: TIGR04053 family radical SAM/SPASM domain-containing protein [Candidatus Latescibacteria bacterium]|nr:TIGR04053 family radical SAM/SPASM domain-containing protein [Candidatus Latescibacterota bacterium]
MRFSGDFAQAPFLVIWEVTRSCALACRHCRAEAIDWRHPDELTLDEGRRLLDDVARMGTPIVILTGGDPLQRDDLEGLIRHGKQAGLRVGTIPAATPRLTRDRVESLKAAHLDQMALSLDGCTADKHDEFRRVEGSFAKTMEGAEWAREAGLPLQINTVFGAWNVEDFATLAALVESLGVVFWEVFFLVPTGRGAALQGCSAEQCEQVFDKLYQMAQRVPFVIKVTEAPHYRRFLMQQTGATSVRPLRRQGIGQPSASPPESGHGLTMTLPGVNAGKGFCFVDHVGNVCPSGFLPIQVGNVRQTSVIDLYRTSSLFQELRNPDLLKGRCGRCEYRTVCGGSRARAYALTDDYLAEDPACLYSPAGVLSEPVMSTTPD